MNRTYNLTLQSTFRESEKIPDFVDEIRDECELDEEPSETFKLVLSEAVTNAIVHGNKEDREKTVDITVYVSEKDISADVKDQGAGFDADKKKNPLKEENLLDTSGRGIFLMKQFADHVEFKQGGTRLYFRVNFNNE